jgi:hypothetical protein
MLVFAWPGAANAQDIGVGAGASHFSGRFGGTERSEIDSVYVLANVVLGGWRTDLTLPYLRVTGAGTINVGGIIVPIEGAGPVEGVGDLTIRVTRSLPESLDLPLRLSLAGQVKLPTGAASVSTGKTDFAFDLEASRDVGRLSPSITVGYRVFGDLEFVPLKDGWSLSAGAGLTLGKLFFNASYDWSEAVAGGPDSQEAFLLAAGPIARGWSWNLFASKGLSAGAADYGLGAGITLGFGRKLAPVPTR